MTGFAIVSTTLGSAEEAKAMARALVETKLAACVQIAPITSIYRWDGKIEEGAEHLLLCKIAVRDFKEVRETILILHTYDVPEIVMTAIEGGSDAYLGWLAAETTRP